jgi:MFS family permease
MTDQTRDRVHFLLLNIGHYLDHLLTLVFATVAALALTREWSLSYAELLAYATPGFFAFGVFSLPAGWLADKWSREGMIAVYFVGIGFASILTAFASSPLQIAAGLFLIGIFAAIYHPVGLAIVTERWRNTGMRLAVNGIWGNFGVGSAALITGYFIDNGGWRAAFVVPGVFSVLVGIIYTVALWPAISGSVGRARNKPAAIAGPVLSADMKAMLWRMSIIIFVTTAVSSLIFQSTTFALPKVFDERLRGIAGSATMLGWFAFMVFAVASMGQLIVGHYLDRIGPRTVFLFTACVQVVFFALMPGLSDWAALLCALTFMLAAFGAIPINDFMIGKMAQGEFRARVYGVRYVISFSVFAVALPLISFIYQRWGFDMLFWVLSLAAAVVALAAFQMPSVLPDPRAVATPVAAE